MGYGFAVFSVLNNPSSFGERLFDFFAVYLNSLSGAFWLIVPSGNVSIFHAAMFLVLVFVLGILLDVFFLSKTSKYNSRKMQEEKNASLKNKITQKQPNRELFIRLYVFWRIFLPDLFIASILMARYTRIDFTKKELYRIAAIVHGIRMGLFVGIIFVVYLVYGIFAFPQLNFPAPSFL